MTGQNVVESGDIRPLGVAALLRLLKLVRIAQEYDKSGRLGTARTFAKDI